MTDQAFEKPFLRSLAVALAVAFAIAAPAWQALTHFGLSAAAFAGQGDSTLRAEPWAFAIWSVIYAGLVLFALWQLWPGVKETPALKALAWPSALTIFGCGVWILASALNQRWASVAIILISAGTLVIALARAPRPANRIVLWPLSLLAGWLTIASALNVLTIMTAEGLVGDSRAWALGGLAAVALIGSAATWAIGSFAYPLPIIWGLIGVWAAEQTEKPTVAVAAGAVALTLLVVGLSRLAFRRGGTRSAVSQR
jgi:hypothetical protein